MPMLFRNFVCSETWLNAAMLSRPTRATNIYWSCQLRILHASNARSLSRGLYQTCKFSSSRSNRLKSAQRYLDDSHQNLSASGITRRSVGRTAGISPEYRPLPIASLGASSDVLVLPQPARRYRDPKGSLPKRAPSLENSFRDMDLIAALEAERGLVEQSDVDSNIEHHRPPNPNEILSENDFWQIVTKLEKGFTIPQLQGYSKKYFAKEIQCKALEATTSEPADAATSEPKDAETENKTMSPDLKSLIYRTDWYPDETEEGNPFVEDQLRGYLTIQHNTKQALALHILRTCWKIDAREVLTSVGELELRLDRPEFDLLTNSRNSPLGRIVDSLRQQDGERLDAFRSRAVLRVTASRNRAFRIANNIERSILDRIQTIPFNIEVRKSSGGFRTKKPTERSDEERIALRLEQEFDALTIEEAATMTGTNIVPNTNKLMGNRRTLAIFCVATPDSKLATPAEVARRLLFSYFTDYDKKLPRLGLQTSHSSETEALIRLNELEGLQWYDRLRQWMRRTSVAGKGRQNDVETYSAYPAFDEKEEASEAEDDINVPLAEDSRKVEQEEGNDAQGDRNMSLAEDSRQLEQEQGKEAEENSDASLAEDSKHVEQKTKFMTTRVKGSPRRKTIIPPAPPEFPFWSMEFATSSQILLGQVLHEMRNALPITPLLNSKDIKISKNHIFTTTVPNLPTLMQSLRLDRKDAGRKESVVMRFEPSPYNNIHNLGKIHTKQGARRLKCFPPIEMTFTIDEVNPMTRNLVLKDISAVVETDTSDLMLPSRQVDLRFQQRTLSYATLTNLPPSITDFLAASQLNLVTGIRTPAIITLPMDRHTTQRVIPQEQFHKSQKRDSWDMWGKDMAYSRNVDYLFCGMDIRKQVSFDFHGWTLVHADVAAGRAGGKRREIVLLPRPTREQVGSEEDFVRTAFELVDVLGHIPLEGSESPDVLWAEAEGYADGGGGGYFRRRVAMEERDASWLEEERDVSGMEEVREELREREEEDNDNDNNDDDDDDDDDPLGLNDDDDKEDNGGSV